MRSTSRPHQRYDRRAHSPCGHAPSMRGTRSAAPPVRHSCLGVPVTDLSWGSFAPNLSLTSLSFSSTSRSIFAFSYINVRCPPILSMDPVPVPAVGAPSLRCLQGRVRCCLYYGLVMPSGLHRTYGAHHLHLSPPPATGGCLFCAARGSRASFLEQTRGAIGSCRRVCRDAGHIHLLLTDRSRDSSTVMQC